MTLQRHLPNFITSLNLACGTGALLCALDGRTTMIPTALLLVGFALLFDLADGRVARHFGVSSPIGLELDSLADLISFGVAPALLLWRHRLTDAGPVAILATVLFVLAGAFRLARFNVLSQQGQPATRFFVGMPIPAAAALALTAGLGHIVPGFGLALSPAHVVASMMLAAVLMVSTIPFPSPKVLPLGNRKFTAALLVATASAAALLGGKVLLVSAAYAAMGLIPSLARRMSRTMRNVRTRLARTIR